MILCASRGVSYLVDSLDMDHSKLIPGVIYIVLATLVLCVLGRDHASKSDMCDEVA